MMPRDASPQQVSGSVMAQLEIFTPNGVVAGTALRGELVQSPDLRSPVAIERARWYPHDGGRPEHRGSVLVPPDDVLVVATADPEVAMTIHATWYAICMQIGPYRVKGRLPTPPGFDPAKALARPGGAFVAIRDATVELMNRPDAGVASRSTVHVNRYAVERVESTLMLGFFFPGAHLEKPAEQPVA
jgi:hypothetical protein